MIKILRTRQFLGRYYRESLRSDNKPQSINRLTPINKDSTLIMVLSANPINELQV